MLIMLIRGRGRRVRVESKMLEAVAIVPVVRVRTERMICPSKLVCYGSSVYCFLIQLCAVPLLEMTKANCLTPTAVQIVSQFEIFSRSKSANKNHLRRPFMILSQVSTVEL
jgi:hypothetical protein